jgi:hypothetical protein
MDAIAFKQFLPARSEPFSEIVLAFMTGMASCCSATWRTNSPVQNSNLHPHRVKSIFHAFSITYLGNAKAPLEGLDGAIQAA